MKTTNTFSLAVRSVAVECVGAQPVSVLATINRATLLQISKPLTGTVTLVAFRGRQQQRNRLKNAQTSPGEVVFIGQSNVR